MQRPGRDSLLGVRGLYLSTSIQSELHNTNPHHFPGKNLTSLLFILRDPRLLGAAVDGSLRLAGITRFSCLRLVRDRRRRPGANKYARWA